MVTMGGVVVPSLALRASIRPNRMEARSASEGTGERGNEVTASEPLGLECRILHRDNDLKRCRDRFLLLFAALANWEIC